VSVARARWSLAAAVTLASMASVTGCETIFGIGELPFPADGGGGDGSPPLDSSMPNDGGMDSRPSEAAPPKEASPEAGPVCTPTLAYAPVDWKPPTAFMQPACTTGQLSAYETCFPDCSNFRQDPANAACVSCIETDEGAVAHGPVITADKNGSVTPVLVNVGGCQAHFDGMSTPGSCGNLEDNARGCLSTECGSCSDFQDPAPGGPAETCEASATAGACAPFVPGAACDGELDGGVAAQCSSLSMFLPLWCAPPGPPPGCYADTPFTPPVWEPPTPFGQAACSPMQISDYIACISSGSCTAFEGEAANATCLACIETDVGAPAYGPVITMNGMPSSANFGGCVANFDGDTAAGGCGDQIDAFNACAFQECNTCSDFAAAMQGGPTQQCEANAFNGGVCSAFNEQPQCDAELVDGGAAVSCNLLSSFLSIWCEGQPVDAGPDAVDEE
jgi:hypothetical protein